MKRLIVAFSILIFFGVSYSALGEHSGDGGGGRTIITVPALGAGERLNELIGACSTSRPFPGLRTKQIDLTPSTTPPTGDIAPPPSTPPTETVPNTNGDASRGASVFEANCKSCHASGFSGNVAGVTERTGLPEGDDKHMPKGLSSLSESDRQALIAYVQSGK